MEMYEYMTLSEEEQCNELWDNGMHLDNFKSIDCSLSLYALHKFFVEVELDVTTDKIIGKHIFKHGQRMEQYAGKLDL